jgi:hypothetical protein
MARGLFQHTLRGDEDRSIPAMHVPIDPAFRDDSV